MRNSRCAAALTGPLKAVTFVLRPSIAKAASRATKREIYHAHCHRFALAQTPQQTKHTKRRARASKNFEEEGLAERCEGPGLLHDHRDWRSCKHHGVHAQVRLKLEYVVPYHPSSNRSSLFPTTFLHNRSQLPAFAVRAMSFVSVLGSR